MAFASLINEAAPITKLISEFPALREVRRESSGAMEWLGVWNCIFFSGSEVSNFKA